MIGDISYKNYKKKDDIHGSVLYPAVMVAPVQKKILQKLIEKNDINSIFDPFHGSGTALYEALELSNDIKLIGCDINPLANLITKVKLEGVNSNIYNEIEKFKVNLNKAIDFPIEKFPNINKWFREDIIESLSLIKYCIRKIKNKKNRLYFWYILSDIIRKYSNTRSSTYKLHIKLNEVIERMDNNLIKEYIQSLETNAYKFDKKAKNFKLYKSDTLERIKKFKNKEFDLSITSPPYGENATTVTYGQFSILTLLWIDKSDLELEGWELNNFSIIDSRSLGGMKKEVLMKEYEKDIINEYTNKISERKKIKVLNFFNDYFYFLNELIRVTNKYIVMTLGNRTVDGININLTKITQTVLEKNGFEKNDFVKREIPSKRIPKKISNVNNKPVNSMNYEYVIIYKRIM